MTYFDEDAAWRDAADDGDGDAPPGSPWLAHAGRVAGALLSVAFVGAIGYWGWQITVRDVGAVPVVRAQDTPMRVAPEDPGGEPAAHQGLAVNSIPAEGTVAAPPDRLSLAPGPVPLTAEDQPVVPDSIAGAPAARDNAAGDGERPLSILEALRVAEAEARGLDPAEALATTAEEESGPVPLMPITRLPPPSPEGAPVMSFPPKPRPAAARPGEARIVQAAFAAAPRPAPGAQLIQLGAYPAESEARAAWAGLMAENGDLLGRLTPLLQQAESGGRRFVRLRASGFDGLADARRFCAALGARGADCVPVAAR